MKNKLCLSAFLLLQFFFISCNSDDSKNAPASENDIDAARNFIRAALDGKFDEARTYMLPDTANNQYLNVAERNYQKADQVTKDGYRTATIRILPVTALNDSTTVVIYSNSFKNDPDTLKVVKVNGQWLTDLKFLYEHDMDTLYKKPAGSDTLK